MKNIAITFLILLASMLTLPLAALSKETPVPVLEASAAVTQEDLSQKSSIEVYDSFRIKMSADGSIVTLSRDDYIFGVVAAEMPALYETEALKAQAIAAYSYACRKKAAASDEYDLTDNPKTHQCYISRETARERWGEKADEYTQKIDSAVKAVSGQVLTYDGGIALTAYHAISSGKTENCSDVWGSDLPYLVSVDSVGDKTAEKYLTTVALTADEVSSLMSGIAKATGDTKNWFSDINRCDTGRVKSLKFCGSDTTGAAVAEALSLRSANFEISVADNTFTFTVRGYGHGLGMSQNGADYMAKQGSSYEEILKWYYTGCELEKP